MSLVGTMVGRYRVLRLLGEGGMARVFAAEDTTVGRQVAIKALLPEYSQHKSILERFMNEAKAMGRIQHPGVIDVFDVTMAPSGELCIIMELLTGQTLREQLWKAGPYAVHEALPLMLQLADTLAAAHAHRIVHRDLKPENIFVIADALGTRLKVLDFGIAKVMDAENVKTATTAQMGTATYMAPEQFRSAKLVDHRADIYAVGCLFFEMLTGKAPFGGRNLFEQMQAHLTQPTPLDRLPPQLPPPVRQLIDRMVVKDRDQRLGSLQEAVAVLNGGVLSDVPLHTPPPMLNTPPPQLQRGGPAPPMTAAVPRPADRSWIWALVAILLVGVGVALTIALT
jgi:serine/threonine protein kinase